MSELNDILTKPYLPKNDNGYIENINIDLGAKGNRDIPLSVPPKPKLNHQVEMWDAINNFEQESWSPNNKGLDSGWDSINKAFDGGVNPGFIRIGADSNVGKTIFLTQLAWQIAERNDDVFVMDFSLDDPFDDKLPRVVASANKVLINAVKNPTSVTQYPMMLARRVDGLNKLRRYTDKYRVYDATFTTDIESIDDEVNRVKIELDAAGLGHVQIVVCIDNFHDLNSREKPNLQEKQKYDHLAQYCADMAIRHKIPLICTGELRKVNGTLRPTVDSIRESVKIKYEAKAILLCHNEVHYKGEGSDIFFKRTDSKLKQPVFEVHFAKNKFGSYKGRLFFESYPEMSRMEEADVESAKHYSSVVFGS
jgi:replicative DNA helicase